MHGQAESLAEGVQAGHLEGGDDGEAELLRAPDPAQPGRVHAVVRLPVPACRESPHTSSARVKSPFRSVTARPGSAWASAFGGVQVRPVAVRLPDAGHPAAGDDFHDEPGGVRLVDALGVEQGRIGHEDRGEPDVFDHQVGMHP